MGMGVAPVTHGPDVRRLWQAAWRWLDASAGSKPLRNGCSGCNCGS